MPGTESAYGGYYQIPSLVHLDLNSTLGMRKFTDDTGAALAATLAGSFITGEAVTSRTEWSRHRWSGHVTDGSGLGVQGFRFQLEVKGF
eukprot:3538857-Rhodomonas_salina.1